MKHLIIGTAGHVDHGKTALIKAMTNIDCDTHKEEKDRGITINLGFSHLDLPSGDSIGIVDVPGHKDFIKTMVAGAYGIDIAMPVIAADSGIMPQTEEHLRIIEMLGIKNGIIVINKTDLVDEETVELAELEINEYLEGTILESAPVVPVSAITGKGISKLIETIQTIIPQIKEKQTGDIFRMYIDRIFNVKGVGFVVTGSVLEGQASTGMDLYLLPGKSKKVKIRNIERHGKSVETVYPGDRAAINLAGLKFEDYSRGMVLSSKAFDESLLVDATLTLFDPTSVLGTWSNVIFYTGTFECSARLHLLDKDELQPGQNGIVQVQLSNPSVLSVNDKYIIRNSSNDKTLGGGTIIDTQPLHHRKRTEKLIKALNELVDATLNSDKISNLIKIELTKINAPAFVGTISEILGKPIPDLLDGISNDPTNSIQSFEIKGNHILLRTDLDEKYKSTVLEEIEAFHKKNPILEEGLSANEFAGKFNFGKKEAGKLYLELLMQRIYEEGLTKKSGNSWALSNHVVKIEPKTQSDLTWLEEAYLDVGMDIVIPKKVEEEAHSRKINKDKLKMLNRYLANNGKLIQYEGEYSHVDCVTNAKKMLLQILLTKEKGINEKEFRELINGTRKYIQFLLGIFTSEGLVTKPKFYIFITDKGKQEITSLK